MEYAVLGADLDRNDLFYLKALLLTLATDLKAVTDSPAAYTSLTAGIINDKYILVTEAVNTLLAITKDGQGASVYGDKANATLVTDIATLQAAVESMYPTVSKATPTQVPASTAQLPPYRVDLKTGAPTPFCSAPVPAPSKALTPSAAVIKKIITPMTTVMTYGTQEKIDANAAARAKLTVGANTDKKGIPLALIAAGIAVAALTLR